MILDPTSTFKRIVVCCVNVADVQKLFHRITEFIRRNFHVFSTNLLGKKFGDDKVVKAHNWSVIKCGEDVCLPGVGVLSKQTVQEAMRRARLDERRGGVVRRRCRRFVGRKG